MCKICREGRYEGVQSVSWTNDVKVDVVLMIDYRNQSSE